MSAETTALDDARGKLQETALFAFQNQSADSTSSLQSFLDNLNEYEDLKQTDIELDIVNGRILGIKLPNGEENSDVPPSEPLAEAEPLVAAPQQSPLSGSELWKSSWIDALNDLRILVAAVPEYEDFKPYVLTDRLTDTYRKNFMEINVMEKAMLYLSGDADSAGVYPVLARLALPLAIFMDMASLLAGVVLYYDKKRQDEKVRETSPSDAPETPGGEDAA